MLLQVFLIFIFKFIQFLFILKREFRHSINIVSESGGRSVLTLRSPACGKKCKIFLFYKNSREFLNHFDNDIQINIKIYSLKNIDKKQYTVLSTIILTVNYSFPRSFLFIQLHYIIIQRKLQCIIKCSLFFKKLFFMQSNKKVKYK